jgi:ribonuclease HI
MSFYAVRFGKIPGIYTCWNECRKQVTGFKGAIYKKFSNKQLAEEFCNNKSKTYNIKQQLRTLKRTKTVKKNINKDPNALYIFTDGSSINNGSKNANSGFGIYIPEPETMQLKISAKLPKGKTNNYAELKAILEALKILNCTDENILKQTKKDKVVIVTDSQYSINCITQWYHSWIKKGWVSATGEEVKNKELIQEIQPLSVKHNVSFKHIKAHTSKKGFFYDGNRVVDKLANGTDV